MDPATTSEPAPVEEKRSLDPDAVSARLDSLLPGNSDRLAEDAEAVEALLENAVGDEALTGVLHGKAGKLSMKTSNGMSILDQVATSEKGGKLIKDVLVQPLLMSLNSHVLEEMADAGWSDFSLRPDTEDVSEDVKSLIAKLTDQQSGKTPTLEQPGETHASESEIKSALESPMEGAGGLTGSRPMSAKDGDEQAAGLTNEETDSKPETAATSRSAAVQEPDDAAQRVATPSRAKTPPGPKKVKPVPVYVRYGGANQAQAPPPSTLDGKYIAQHLGTALTLAMAEIAEKRPWDPIEYLAQWLYDYHRNEAFAKKQAEMLKNIREAEARQNEIEELKFKRKEEYQRMQEDVMRMKKEEEEEKRRQELEELQRSNKEAALAQKPQLPTVKEDEEAEPEADVDDDPNVKDRDEDGMTEMHKLAAQPDIDLKSLMELGYSVADRDAKGRSVRDIAEVAGRKETVLAIDNHIKQLLSDGIVSTLERLVLEGYDHIDTLVDDNLPEVTTNFLQNMENLKEKKTHIIQLSETGKDGEVKEALEALPQLNLTKDQNGHSLLHRAVACDNVTVVEYLATQNPGLLQARDNKNRTPLHYAYSKSEDLVKLLINKGAKQNSRDVYKRLPIFYKENPVNDDLSQSLPVTESEPNTQQAGIQNAEQSSDNPGESETAPESSSLATTSVAADTEAQKTVS